MSEPQNTVRGLLRAIFNALGGLANLGEVLAELRYLNKRLTGFDSTGAALPSEQEPPLLVTARDTRLDLQTVLARLTYLTGAEGPSLLFGEEGLPGYLSQVVGNVFYAESRGTNLLVSVESAKELMNLLVDTLYGFNPPQGYPPSMLARSTEAAEQIRQLISTIYPPPLDSDIIQLLASIDANQARAADCCEEGGGGGGSGTINPQPSFGECDWAGTVYQVQGFTDLGVAPGSCDPPQRRWAADWGLSGAPGIGSKSTYEGAPYWGVVGNTGQDLEVCLAYDFTGNDLPRSLGFDTATTPESATDASCTENVYPSPVGTFSFATAIYGAQDPPLKLLGSVWVMDEGQTPSRNLWAKFRVVTIE